MLDDNNDLRVHYSAVADKPTVLNLTNHTYFNLAGAGDGTVLDQVAMINADKITPVDNTLIPTGKMMDVAGRISASRRRPRSARTSTPTTSSSNTPSRNRAATTSTMCSTIPAT